MNDKNTCIHMVMICDDNFVKQTRVAITSILENKHEETEIKLFLVAVECKKESLDLLTSLEGNGLHISIIVASLNRFKHIKQISHVPISCLYKFLLCDLLPEYDKLLYLDGDIIVRDDLQELYDTDLGECYIAGIPHSLGIVTGERKINGGVLLFNAGRIRDEHLSDEFIRVRNELGDRKSMDQETFHIVFGDKKLFLSPKYNVMTDKLDYERKYYSMTDYNAFYGTKYKSRKEVFDTAFILHFTGAMKPWEYRCSKGYDEWIKYYKQSFVKHDSFCFHGYGSYLIDSIKKNGIKWIWWTLKDKFLCILGDMHIYLDKSHGEWN